MSITGGQSFSLEIQPIPYPCLQSAPPPPAFHLSTTTSREGRSATSHVGEGGGGGRQGAHTLHNVGICRSLPDREVTRDTCIGSQHLWLGHGVRRRRTGPLSGWWWWWIRVHFKWWCQDILGTGHYLRGGGYKM